MATALQLHTLRIKLNDYVDKDGNLLSEELQAFSNTELDALYDDSINEVSDGITPVTAQHDAWAMLVARADGILLLAQDEARRIRWVVNNKTIDEGQVAGNLINIAKELRLRYENAKNRQQKADISLTTSRPTSRRMDFNDTVRSHSERNFNNRDVRRNTPGSHRSGRDCF